MAENENVTLQKSPSTIIIPFFWMSPPPVLRVSRHTHMQELGNNQKTRRRRRRKSFGEEETWDEEADIVWVEGEKRDDEEMRWRTFRWRTEDRGQSQ